MHSHRQYTHEKPWKLGMGASAKCMLHFEKNNVLKKIYFFSKCMLQMEYTVDLCLHTHLTHSPCSLTLLTHLAHSPCSLILLTDSSCSLTDLVHWLILLTDSSCSLTHLAHWLILLTHLAHSPCSLTHLAHWLILLTDSSCSLTHLAHSLILLTHLAHLPCSLIMLTHLTHSSYSLILLTHLAFNFKIKNRVVDLSSKLFLTECSVYQQTKHSIRNIFETRSTIPIYCWLSHRHCTDIDIAQT